MKKFITEFNFLKSNFAKLNQQPFKFFRKNYFKFKSYCFDLIKLLKIYYKEIVLTRKANILLSKMTIILEFYIPIY